MLEVVAARPDPAAKADTDTGRAADPPDPRAEIDTLGLIRLLQDHAFGREDLGRDRLQSAIVLLKKTLPDLTSADIQTGARAPAVVSAQPMSEHDWQRLHSDHLGSAAGAAEGVD